MEAGASAEEAKKDGLKMIRVLFLTFRHLACPTGIPTGDLHVQRAKGRRLTSLGCHKVGTVCHFGDNTLLGDEGTIQCVRKYNRENRGQEIGIHE